VKLVELFGGKCALCGYNKCVQSLQFHHLDPKNKKFAISAFGHCRTWKSVVEEANKCLLLCSNCHFEVENNIVAIPTSIMPSNIEIHEKFKAKIINLPKKGKRKVERPPVEQVKNEVLLLGYSAVGRKYGVSDNAIRKWLR
jgi:hypothetical protein